MYQQRHNNYTKLLQQCPFLQANIQVIYKQCYLPTVSYPLPATSIQSAKLYKKLHHYSLQNLDIHGHFPSLHQHGPWWNWTASPRRRTRTTKKLQLLKHLHTETGIGQVLLSSSIINSCWANNNLSSKIHAQYHGV